MTDFRALCAELLAALESWSPNGGAPLEEGAEAIAEAHLINRARAALAEPQPKPPTVMEIIELADEIEAAELGQVDLVRAALARWGNHPGSPGSSTEPTSGKDF